MSEPTVEELTAQLDALRKRIAARDAADVGKAILAALTAAGYKPADPAAAKILVESAALASPTDPAAAALDLAKKHPAVFGSPAPVDGKGATKTAEEREAELRANGALSPYGGVASRPVVDTEVAARLAAARAKPTSEQTTEERAMVLTASRIW